MRLNAREFTLLENFYAFSDPSSSCVVLPTSPAQTLVRALWPAGRGSGHLAAKGSAVVLLERLVLVQVGSEQVLLGLSAGRITPLHVLEEPVHLPDAEPANPEFAQRLMELLGRDNKDKP